MAHPVVPRGRSARAVLLFLVLAAAALGLPALTAPAGAADPLLSQGRPTTASSTENAGTPAAAATDGSTGTRWASAFADPQWIRVDLGATATITQVVLNWEAAYGRAFQLQTSADGATWTTIFSTTTGTGGVQTVPVTGSGRYVRMYGTQRATAYGFSLWEFQVYGTTGGGTPGTCGSTNAAQGKPATASSTENAGTAAYAAVDGNAGTRWSSAATDPQWIQVDLGASVTVCGVTLQWEAAYARAFQVQVSDNGSTWTTVYSTTTGTGGTQTLTVSGTGRYLRLYGTQRATGYGYSLWELQVRTTGGGTTTPPPGGRLVFADEFNDPAGTTPSTARWTAETGPAQNNELQYYTPNRNAATDGAGNLAIEARREVTAGSSCPGGPCQYTSGRINTAGKFTVQYGRIEARIKVSGTPGLWPAFWMLGADFPQVGWPTSGEIDIMEHLGRIPDTTYSTVHGPNYFGGGGIGSPYTIAGDFAAAFHTYAVDWSADRMTFSVDGTSFLTLTRAQVEARGRWVFDHPFFLILNNAVGGDWPGPPNASTVLPQRMLVDYVRVYQ